MFCKYCGKEIDEQARYCSACGGDQLKKTVETTVQPKVDISGLTSSSMQSVVLKGLGEYIAIALSAIVLLTSFMTWMRVDISWVGGSYNIFGALGFCQEAETILVKIILWAVIILGVICLIMHAVSLYRNLTKKDQALSMACMAGLWSLILCITYFFLVLAAKHEANEVDWKSAGDLIHMGAGSILCFVFSLAQFVGCAQLQQNRSRTKPTQENTVVCPYCNTPYVRYTAATACPQCKHLPSGDTVGSAVKTTPQELKTSDTVICPFCKEKNPKGTVYCKGCHAQIGAKPNAEPASILKFCKNCGNKLAQDGQFCQHCGTKQ